MHKKIITKESLGNISKCKKLTRCSQETKLVDTTGIELNVSYEVDTL